MESVLRYVTAPDFVRQSDARHMSVAITDATWADIDALMDYYQRQSPHEKVFNAPAMAGRPTDIIRRVGG